MNEERLDRVEALFHQAADLPPERQRALLDEACAGDPRLRAEVEKLLADDARLRTEVGDAAGMLNSPLVRPLSSTAGPAPAPAVRPALPERIGRYRILRLLGEGGMGAVYEAEQDSPRRPVALKVIRPGLVSPALLRRFAQEAEVLGRLSHPGIAAIYEAGLAEDGQPFFALELVRGLALDEHARRHDLGPAARLGLLARVCDAVQHAHERGVLHRDLKPGNILVDEAGQPRVLDFGVARALEDDRQATADRTRTGQLVGTLDYMSPEQVAADWRAAGLDARSDVYTLGVILYELLAGRLPYALEHLPLPEVARVIREQEPVRLGALDARLRGDVETIAGKALEKDRDMRYASAAELAADVRRHLSHEPIRARPPSALYQLGKFVRRHKALVVTTAAFLALLLGAGAVTAWQAVKLARAERDRAVQQADRSREAHEALARAAALRDQARATNDPGKWAAAREEAREAKARVESGPVDAELPGRVAVLLRELDEEEKDHQMVARLDDIRLRRAEIKRERLDDTRAAARRREGLRYAEAFRWYGVDVEALPVAEAARRVREPKAHGALLAALDHWAWYREEGPSREKLWAVADAADDNPWQKRLRQAARRKDRVGLKKLAGDRRALRQPPAVLALLGKALVMAGAPEEAAAFLRRAQGRHPGDFWLNNDLAYLLFMDVRPRRAAEALGYCRAALALRPASPGAQLNLGTVLVAQGDLSGAEACFRRAIELSPQSATPHWHLGMALHGLGDLPGAVACGRKALGLAPNDAGAWSQLGLALRWQGDLPAAAAAFRRAAKLEPESASAHYNLGVALLEQGDLAGAAASLRRARARGPKDADLVLAVQRCDRFLELNGRLPALLKGEARPVAGAECLWLGYLCAYKGLYASSARYFTEAFAANATLAEGPGPRYQAACSAARAGCGLGAEGARLDESGRAGLRQKALAWLRAELARRARHLEGAPPEARPRLAGELRRWQYDAALAGARDADRLAALPEAERAAWQQLWADVASVVARGAAK